MRSRLLVVAGLLPIALTGCGGDSGPAASPDPAPSISRSASASSSPTQAPPAMSRAAATRLLRDAVATGNERQVRRALEAGARLEVRDRQGRTPLVAATKARRARIAQLLLAAGADPDAKDDLADSAFLYAGAEGFNRILRMTLRRGADVRSTNRFDGTALIPASEHGHVETVRILIRAGVPVNHVNDLGWTALHEAIVLGDGSADQVTVVRLLLQAGADPTIPDGDGVLPRDLALQRGFTGIVAEIDRAAR